MEISAVDYSVEGFTFRLSHEDAERMAHNCLCCVRCAFHSLVQDETVELSDFELAQEEKNEDGALFRVTAHDADFTRCMRVMLREVTEYTKLKMQGEDAALTRRYSEYPENAEEILASDFLQWRRERLAGIKADAQWEEVLASVKELALAAYRPSAMERYCGIGQKAYWQQSLQEAGLAEHPLARRTPNVLYLGNPYCARLLPDEEEGRRMLAQCSEEGVLPVWVFPPMTEDEIPRFSALLSMMDEAMPETAEIVVNDVGFPLMIRECFPERFTLTAGVLLVKRRKDTRVRWQGGAKQAMPPVTSANSPYFRAWLRTLGISRVSWETCGYPIETCAGDTLHLPFYQMSTATNCTLQSVCMHGQRGYQKEREMCGRECERMCFLYGEALNMAGRGNSVFGFDENILRDGAYFSRLIAPGIRRIVADFL